MSSPAPMVSIIVPVYNGESTLRRCVDSVLNQDYRDFELLLVNDGSTDGSGAICREYAAQDSRVRLIEKANSGVSDSRNRGLDAARGTYLQFLDCDDWITPDATCSLVDIARGQDCHLVVADFYRVVGKRVSHKGDIEDEGILTREEYAAHMMENPADFYYGVLWNKLYRRDIIETYALHMDPAISWCEDFMFNLEYIRWAKRFVAVHIPIYYYVKRRGSLVSQGISISKTIKMKLTVFEYYNRFYKHILDEKDYEKNRLQVYRFLVDAAGDGMVPPAIFPGSKKLGEERISVAGHALTQHGILMDEYRGRKLLEYFVSPLAQKYGLSLVDLRTLVHLSYPHPPFDRKELADLVGISRSSLSFSLQRLGSKDYIQVEEVKNEKAAPHAEGMESRTVKQLQVTILPQAQPLLDEIVLVENRYRQSIFNGFSPEEQRLYRSMNERITENIQHILQ